MTCPPVMRCAGCGGAAVAGEHVPFRCPHVRSGDDIDHVLGRPDPPAELLLEAAGDSNPFIRFRRASYAWQLARCRGMTDDEYVAVVRRLDAQIARVDGDGFSVTAYGPQATLAKAVGLDSGLWLKDETGNVSGSHKARHLMGLAVHLAVAEATGLDSTRDQTLAIASCGNAALAAAVVARAAKRTLEVFVPDSANERVVHRLEQLGARVITCPRLASDPPGDPCYLRFVEAVAGGALPFACQGNENGLTIDGGMTLGFELATAHAAGGWPALDRIALQIGGGALASSTIQALRWARRLGVLARMPAVHAIQTEAAHPVVDAWRRVMTAIERRVADTGFQMPTLLSDAERAQWVAANAEPVAVSAALAHAAEHRSDYMKPITAPPRSIASGILDDETYDWHQVVRGMVETGGWPVVVTESQLASARELGRAQTGINVSATGASGLAGVLAMLSSGAMAPTDRVAVVFTGVQR